MAVGEVGKSAMMSHLIDALDRGQDIGHYGRLVFVMVGQHFLSEDELKSELMKDKDCDEQKAQAIIKQVEAKSYSPPKRERIIEWMNQQDFPICENAEDQGSCNIYNEIQFPPEVYEKISSYYESKN